MNTRNLSMKMKTMVLILTLVYVSFAFTGCWFTDFLKSAWGWLQGNNGHYEMVSNPNNPIPNMECVLGGFVCTVGTSSPK